MNGDLEIINFDPLHDATSGVTSYLQNWGQSLNLSHDAYQLGDTWREDSVAWKDWNPLNDQYDPGEEGVFTIVASTDTGCGRVAAVADNTFADAPLDGWPQNDQIIRGLLEWATSGPACPAQQKDVLVDELHNNYLTLDPGRAQEIVDTQGWGDVEAYLLSILPTRLSDEFHFERAASGELTGELLANYDALIVPWYLDSALTADEVQAVKDFVNGGGGLVLVGDCAFANPNPELVSAYGIEFDVHCLRAPLQNSTGDIVVDSLADHPAVSSLSEFTLNWGQSLELSGDAFWLADTTGRDAWRDRNWNEQYDEGVDETGTFNVIGAYDGYGRVVVIADDGFGDTHMDWTQNDEALRHLLRWAMGKNAPPATPTWTLQTVDSAGDVGHYTSIAVDSSNYPHISYYDETNDNLRYAHLDASGWHTQTVDSEGTKGIYTSLALDGSDYPHISYADNTLGHTRLKYAYMDATGWYSETVDTDTPVGFHSSIALDQDGFPHISYYDNSNGHLRYAYQDAGGWHLETADSDGPVGEYTSLALDAGGYPHVSYYDGGNGFLKYAYQDAGGWHYEFVDQSADVGTYGSLALDREGYPHVSYHDVSNRDLKYAYRDASGWHSETVDSGGLIAMYTASLALYNGRYPHISYYDRSNENLKYAYTDETGWHLQTVDDGETQGLWSSLALDGVGRAHISYQDLANRDLKYCLGEFPMPLVAVPTEHYRRAALHLESFRGVDEGWDVAVIDDQVKPLYRPDVEGIAYYEFPVVTYVEGLKQPAGFIVVSTGPHDYPIPHWSTEGLPPSGEVQASASALEAPGLDTGVNKVYRLDSLSYAGENTLGDLVATWGDLPPKIAGFDPAWLEEPIEDREVVWAPDQPSLDDANADQLSYTTVVTGPEPPPQLQLQPWDSWNEIKTTYSETFGAHLELLATDAAEEWEAEEHISQDGIILYTRDVHDVPLLYDLSTFDLSGPGLPYVDHAVIAAPAVLRIRVTGAPPEDPEELVVTIHYENGIDETVTFMIAARYFAWLPMLSRESTGTASVTGASATLGSGKYSGYANGWHWYRAGTDKQQPQYYQLFPGEYPNTTGCMSGCGGTAWSMLFAWADYQAGHGNSYWSSRWGLYLANGGYGSNVVAPLTQDSGVNNIMWEIRGYIDTFCSFGQGATAPWDMAGADEYLRGRTGTKLRTRYNSFGVARDKYRNQARDIIKNNGTPVVVATGWYIGGHYPLAYGYAYRNYDVCYYRYLGRCLIKDTKTQHSFKLNYGWGGGNQRKGWVGASTWFAGWIYP